MSVHAACYRTALRAGGYPSRHRTGMNSLRRHTMKAGPSLRRGRAARRAKKGSRFGPGQGRQEELGSGRADQARTASLLPVLAESVHVGTVTRSDGQEYGLPNPVDEPDDTDR